MDVLGSQPPPRKGHLWQCWYHTLEALTSFNLFCFLVWDVMYVLENVFLTDPITSVWRSRWETRHTQDTATSAVSVTWTLYVSIIKLRRPLNMWVWYVQMMPYHDLHVKRFLGNLVCLPDNCDRKICHHSKVSGQRRRLGRRWDIRIPLLKRGFKK